MCGQINFFVFFFPLSILLQQHRLLAVDNTVRETIEAVRDFFFEELVEEFLFFISYFIDVRRCCAEIVPIAI